MTELIFKLKASIDLISRYQEKISGLLSTTIKQHQLLEEAKRRLNYLEFIFEKIQELQPKLFISNPIGPVFIKLQNKGTLSTEEMAEFWKRNPIKNFQNKEKLWNELAFFTESFYYQAFRCGKCIEKLPKLNSFRKNKYNGINIVRNQLIEHPDKAKHSQVLFWSIALGYDAGPVLKNARTGEEENKFPQEKGLKINASEFLDNLIELLKKNT